MIEPYAGPSLFDTSAESWLARNPSAEIARWLYSYLGLHQISVSAVTVTERVRSYRERARIEAARVAYLTQLGAGTSHHSKHQVFKPNRGLYRCREPPTTACNRTLTSERPVRRRTGWITSGSGLDLLEKARGTANSAALDNRSSLHPPTS